MPGEVARRLQVDDQIPTPKKSSQPRNRVTRCVSNKIAEKVAQVIFVKIYMYISFSVEKSSP
jgi:hypothetical protein